MAVLSIRWLETGKPVASKNAPALVQALIDMGVFDQKPLAKELNELNELASSDNPYNVQKGEVWEDLSSKRTPARKVLVLALTSRYAVVVGDRGGRRTCVKLTRFSGKPGRYRRVHTNANIDSEVRA